VRFRHLRWFILVAFAANAAAFFATAISGNAFISYVTALGTLAAVSYCIRCGTCGKSPFTFRRGIWTIGSPIPEAVCSKCGQRLIGRGADDV
jgi:hypothetical protein